MEKKNKGKKKKNCKKRRRIVKINLGTKVAGDPKASFSIATTLFGMTLPGIEPQSPGPLANTLLIRMNGKIFF